jgi:hypothetical protein
VREAKDEASPAVLSRDQYLLMHRKMLLAIEPSISPKSAVLTAAEDWERDSEGKPFMDRARFDWCWFELADLWTNSMLVEDYVEFLQVRSYRGGGMAPTERGGGSSRRGRPCTVAATSGVH